MKLPKRQKGEAAEILLMKERNEALPLLSEDRMGSMGCAEKINMTRKRVLLVPGG